MVHTHPEGILHITIIQAKKLHGEDLIGKNDPYVELWLDSKYKQRTKELSNTNDPVWNQEFTFPLEQNSSFHKLNLLVSDKDVVGSDKIGEASVDFSSVFTGQPLDDWLKLKSGSLGIRSKGELHLRIAFTPTHSNVYVPIRG